MSVKTSGVAAIEGTGGKQANQIIDSSRKKVQLESGLCTLKKGKYYHSNFHFLDRKTHKIHSKTAGSEKVSSEIFITV